MRQPSHLRLRALVFSLLLFALPHTRADPSLYHHIQVVDEATGRGVPLVEVETTFHSRYITDSAGRVAFLEPGLMDKEVYLFVRSHGYEAKADGFGYRGARITPTPGGKSIIKIARKNIAERLYRLTGAGIYRDTILLGEKAPLAAPLLSAGVVGQDSAQAVIYKGRAHWFWGDTSFHNYPLGNFRTTGATVDLANLRPNDGINFNYFTDPKGYSGQMAPFEPKEGVVWVDGLCVVEGGMIARFERLKGLGSPLEQGLVIWSDERHEFERFGTFEMSNAWRKPRGQSLVVTNAGAPYVYFCAPFPSVRVPATLDALREPARYEAWTPIKDGQTFKRAAEALNRNAAGELVYRWTTQAPPLSPKEENELLEAGLLKTNELCWLPLDVDGGKRPVMHGGSVRWNNHRKRHIFVGNQIFGTSMLGEVWHAEADEITGPWKRAKKIATHHRYDFYNPVHHAFLDEDGGRLIHFEGTYTFTFSGQTNATPRYEYNQLLYRLDLSDPRLQPLHGQ